MSLLGTIAGALGASGASGGMNLLGDVAGSWATNSAKESLNKNITQTNYKIQKKYDLWTIEQDKAYEQWWQNYLYNLQNNEYYQLAKKYATNTASWAVEGLKRAGLNPILAGIDSNLSSSTGDAQPQQSGHKVSSGSVRGASVSGGHNLSHGINLANAIQSFSASDQARSQAEINKAQATVQRETLPSQIASAKFEADKLRQESSNLAVSNEQIQANTAESLARAELIHSQAKKNAVDTYNAAKNAGLSGPFGAASRLGAEIQGPRNALERRLEEFVNRQFGVNGSDNSAKVITVQGKRNPMYYDEYFNRLDKESYYRDYSNQRSSYSDTLDHTHELLQRMRRRLERKR